MALLFSDVEAEEERVYVAVGDGNNESTLMLWWAVQRFPNRKFSILHVRLPSNLIFPPSLLQAQRDMETTMMSDKLDQYILMCKESGIQADKLYVDSDSVENGILDLISLHRIQILIMGAAADQNYDIKMLEPKSGKAVCVNSHAPLFCRILFICRGNLICTREARIDTPSSIAEEIIPQATLNSEAVYQANMLETICREELRKRMEIEAELKLLKTHHDRACAEANNQELVIINHEQNLAKSEQTIEELVEAVRTYKQLAESVMELSSELNPPDIFLTFPSSDILTATSESDQSSQLLCEGELGNMYKAVLYHTDVVLRFLREDELPVLENEVKILSKFRHPNLATLIGASPETRALVYEHLPNGTLEDRLTCKGDTRPLSWQTRIRIAVELCSALIFLHSHGVIHGALRPSCVLLDANFSCKIMDFRSTETSCSSVYIGQYTDPSLFDSNVPYTGADVYPFGLLLLELLTGRPGFSVVEDVQSGLSEDTLGTLLDTSAGEWSVLLAKQIAYVGMRCCQEDSQMRADLKSDVWRVLDPMRLSSGSALSFRVGETPSYFVCPITQEVMEDPHLAADGYTYEAEALKQWLECGNGTSPMTNLPLEDTRLLPNRALRSAIQEWLQLQQP